MTTNLYSYTELADALRASALDMGHIPHRDAANAAARALRDLSTSVAVDVIHRTQVGACIPFTVLPKHYLGKRVRIVIEGDFND